MPCRCSCGVRVSVHPGASAAGLVAGCLSPVQSVKLQVVFQRSEPYARSVLSQSSVTFSMTLGKHLVPRSSVCREAARAHQGPEIASKTSKMLHLHLVPCEDGLAVRSET